MIDRFDIDGFTAGFHRTMSSIPAADWDACGTADHPLLQHRHLRILEECGVAVPAAGFHPHHVVLRGPDGTVAGAAPAYLKTSSSGEMAIDLGMPLAHMRTSGPYYPKLQVEVPMIPNPGPRLLVRPDGDAGGDRVRAAVLGALREMAVRAGAASVQITYMTAADQRAAVAAGFLPTESNVFIWHDRGLTDFDGFVAAMTRGPRAGIRKDRRLAGELGLRFTHLKTEAITADLAPRMFDFYKATFDRYGTTPGLNRGYFEAVFREMPDVVYLVVAFKDEEWAAVAMGIEGRRRLHAQYWGQAGSHKNLIFEMFYREMEYALAHGLESIDYGSGGDHKAPRGIGLEAAHHALWFRDAGFVPVVARSCAARRDAAAQERAVICARLPFADGPDGRAGRADEPDG